MLRSRPILEQAEPRGSQTVPPPDEKPESYAVRFRDGINGTVEVVGHDRHGEPFITVNMKRRCVKPSIVQKMKRWCRQNEDPVELNVF